MHILRNINYNLSISSGSGKGLLPPEQRGRFQMAACPAHFSALIIHVLSRQYRVLLPVYRSGVYAALVARFYTVTFNQSLISGV